MDARYLKKWIDLFFFCWKIFFNFIWSDKQLFSSAHCLIMFNSLEIFSQWVLKSKWKLLWKCLTKKRKQAVLPEGGLQSVKCFLVESTDTSLTLFKETSFVPKIFGFFEPRVDERLQWETFFSFYQKFVENSWNAVSAMTPLSGNLFDKLISTFCLLQSIPSKLLLEVVKVCL